MMINAGIVGATGYAGAELVRILMGHRNVRIQWLASKNYTDAYYSDIYRNFFHITEKRCVEDHLEALSEKADIIFMSTPQGYCASMLNEKILNRTKVVDLSADFRIRDVSIYEKWYNIKHDSPELIQRAVYGLCEINRERIRETKLIANPGCYTTCAILAAYPLAREGIIEMDSLIVDAKSGASGAGRGAKTANLFCEVNENIKAYGVGTHRHTPEIEEQLGLAAGQEVVISFTPHLVPMSRGILITEYAKIKGGIDEKAIEEIYREYYGNEPFVRLLPCGVCPETRWVRGSNFIDIGFFLDRRTERVVLMGAIDNLVKGAAGQAVQNMNIAFEMEETEGLEGIALFP